MAGLLCIQPPLHGRIIKQGFLPDKITLKKGIFIKKQDIHPNIFLP